MDSIKPGCGRNGFTLIELLVVIGIVAVIAAILFPVFAGIREKGRWTQCLSNERQIGMAVLQYAGDNNETLFVAGEYARGLGWAGRCYPYVKSIGVYRCPNDATADVPAGAAYSVNGQAMSAVSYGFNSNLTGEQVPALVNAHPIPSVALGQVTAPAQTVLLFEVGGNVVALADPRGEDQSAYGNTVQGAALGGPAGPISDYTFPIGHSTNPSGLVLYATGNMGGVLLNGATKGGVPLAGARGSDPRHGDGANYAACDGHVVWLRPGRVSPGFSADAANGLQVVGGSAAGTTNPGYTLTFSSE